MSIILQGATVASFHEDDINNSDNNGAAECDVCLDLVTRGELTVSSGSKKDPVLLRNVAMPREANDATTKAYVDGLLLQHGSHGMMRFGYTKPAVSFNFFRERERERGLRLDAVRLALIKQTVLSSETLAYLLREGALVDGVVLQRLDRVLVASVRGDHTSWSVKKIVLINFLLCWSFFYRGLKMVYM